MAKEDLNYEELNFKCGLEIHQQLDADGRKLFCNCPAVLRSDEPEFEIKRKLHAVAGEKGEVDVAAKYQASLKKSFIYQGYDTTCLIELDESPPREINSKALKIAIQVALLLNCKILPITQIMRKTVIDGSNTSGFQRTVLIAQDGYVETKGGRVGVDTICLEEDSARKISEKGNLISYRLDRLGIPLVEIATSPDIKNPEQAKEVALHIGEVLRACSVRRGIGTIRQDVNVSIRGENRVELKGMQDIKTFICTIENEVLRQKKLSDKGEPTKAEVRNALNDKKCTTEFLRPMPGAARMYPETDLPLLKIGRKIIDDAKKSLPKKSSELREELRNYGLHEELIKLVLKSGKIEDFKELISVRKSPEFVAKVLTLYPKELASKKDLDIKKVENILHKDILVNLLEAVNKNKIKERDVKKVLEMILEGKTLQDALKFEKQDTNLIEEKIIKLMKEKPGLRPNAYMGLIMKELREKSSGIDAKEVMRIIEKYLGGKG